MPINGVVTEGGVIDVFDNERGNRSSLSGGAGEVHIDEVITEGAVVDVVDNGRGNRNRWSSRDG